MLKEQPNRLLFLHIYMLVRCVNRNVWSVNGWQWEGRGHIIKAVRERRTALYLWGLDWIQAIPRSFLTVSIFALAAFMAAS